MERNGCNDFVLDTDGSCFLCRNPVSFHKHNPAEEPASSAYVTSQIYSLYYLSTYLKMDMSKVFSEPEGPIPPQLLAMVQTARLKANLCQDCAHLTETFSKLYRNFEKTKIEMAFYLNLIKGKLVQGKEADKGEEHLQSSNAMADDGLFGKKKIVNVLRTEAMQKCANKIASVAPALTIKVQNLTTTQTAAKRLKIKEASRFKKISKTSPSESIAERIAAPEIKLEEAAYSQSDVMADDYDDTGESYHHFEDDKTHPSSVSTAIEPRSKTESDKLSRLHPVTGKYECTLCSKQFGSTSAFQYHHESIHLQIKYQCNLCGKQFSRRSDYNRHHSSIHLQAKVKCDKCNRAFSRKDKLLMHRRKGDCAK